MQMPNLPQRVGVPPETGATPPQLQFSETSPPNVYHAMAEWFFSTFPHTREEPTRISVPTSRALWLDESINAKPEAFMPPSGFVDAGRGHPRHQQSPFTTSKVPWNRIHIV